PAAHVSPLPPPLRLDLFRKALLICESTTGLRDGERMTHSVTVPVRCLLMQSLGPAALRAGGGPPARRLPNVKFGSTRDCRPERTSLAALGRRRHSSAKFERRQTVLNSWSPRCTEGQLVAATSAAYKPAASPSRSSSPKPHAISTDSISSASSKP